MDHNELLERMIVISARMVDHLGLSTESLKAAYIGLNLDLPVIDDRFSAAELSLYRQIREFHFDLSGSISCYCAQTEFFRRLAMTACDKLRNFYIKEENTALLVHELHQQFVAFERLVFVHLAQITLLRDSLRTSSLLLLGLLQNEPIARSTDGESRIFPMLAGNFGQTAMRYAQLLDFALEALVCKETALATRHLHDAAGLLVSVSKQANVKKERALQGFAPRYAAEFAQIVALHSGHLSSDSAAVAQQV